MYNTFSDGEYCLSVAAGSCTVGARIYCHDMSSCSPREYLTLPAGPDNNYSETRRNHDDACTTGLIKFEKLGLNLTTMMINSWDWTFTIQRDVNTAAPCDSYPFYGYAYSCTASGTASTAVDLTGTTFYIPDDVTWVTVLYTPYMQNVARTRQVFAATCGGDCGGCAPQYPGQLSVYYNSSVIEDRVMPVAYDAAYDVNTCTLD